MSHVNIQTIFKAWDAAYSLVPGEYKKGFILVGGPAIFYYGSSSTTSHCLHHYYLVSR